MESNMEREVKKEDPAPAGAQRMARLFRVLVMGGVVLAVACASVPRGETGDPDGGSDGGGGGVPSW
jgi:hypothetical protein